LPAGLLPAAVDFLQKALRIGIAAPRRKIRSPFSLLAFILRLAKNVGEENHGRTDEDYQGDDHFHALNLPFHQAKPESRSQRPDLNL
jgi:hypothetical protein